MMRWWDEGRGWRSFLGIMLHRWSYDISDISDMSDKRIFLFPCKILISVMHTGRDVRSTSIGRGIDREKMRYASNVLQTRSQSCTVLSRRFYLPWSMLCIRDVELDIFPSSAFHVRCVFSIEVWSVLRSIILRFPVSVSSGSGLGYVLEAIRKDRRVTRERKLRELAALLYHSLPICIIVKLETQTLREKHPSGLIF